MCYFSNMDLDLEKILDETGPCLSTKFVRLLIDKGLKPEAARQRVSRAKGSIRKFNALPFPYKANFLYLQKDYNSAKFWDGLRKAIVEHSPSYGPALTALIQRGGIMPKAHFQIACGAPISQKKRLWAETILARFIKSKLIREVAVPGVGQCIEIADSMQASFSDFKGIKARLVAENILLLAIRDWIRNLAIGSYDKIAIRNETDDKQPTVGTFAWDLTGPSYLAPLVRWPASNKPPQPGFIACDVLLSNVVTEQGLAPFLAKCTTLRSLKNVGPCLQIFVAEEYTADAFRAARSAGIIPATTESLFGRDIAKAIGRLIAILTEAAAGSTKPEVFEELFARLGKIEGAATNLRGALFEFIVADLIRTKEAATQFHMNRIVYDEMGGKAEVDVFFVQGGTKAIFVECKGYQPAGTIPDTEVERWLDDRIQIFERYAKQHPDYKNLYREYWFWTSASFSPESLALLEHEAVTRKKYTIRFKDGQQVKEYANELKGSPIIKILKDHFFEHPLATAEKAVQAQQARFERARNYKQKQALMEIPEEVTLALPPAKPTLT